MGDARQRGRTFREGLVALGFLTVVPVPEGAWRDPGSFGRSFAWFPLVGLGVGAALALAALALGTVLPPLPAAALLVALWAALTGGLHLDGLMDAADGLLCAKSPADRLAVMQDSGVGAFGVLAGGCVLLVKFAALGVLLDPGARDGLFLALFLAPLLGRWAMVLLAVGFPYAGRAGGLGGTFTRGAGRRELALASATGGLALLAGCLLAGNPSPVLATLSGGVAAAGVALLALRRVGGLTGDVYGAAGELFEVAALVALCGWYAG
ncbi:cobS: cobalamin 5'-phosphate synthase [Rubrobacter radiotolerans]|uniref:Adenosylcobinamide-GDP ribazoletransferase n=1 Tax=Rubrobacter radiotolerans TaxID=42256 RepID=A0A023X239_RUBRA|nr:adenosylcobinamide-GDP ribazoletransferase [Rubrobacter radiotolerans]AHY46109.1 cobS: cobalamin 5'-phosphate synthase [Rubrobacter radiotolerans]MDX5893519.1 adenosylcobinamide-GDP ribazoletransferase [Rubrobacter radiotolerans]SMC03907.1 cobalamin-5'-phosphate synthase [Rubrobacter radiotolerans DSM 5868]